MVNEKERMMKVAELIAILQKMDQNLDVEMAMKMEYQCPIEADMVREVKYDGVRYVVIDSEFV